jgi:hypothetical protein
VKLLSSPTGVSIVLYRTTSQDYFDKAPVSPDGTPVIGIPMTATRCGADRFLFPILLPDVGTQPLLYILVGSWAPRELAVPYRDHRRRSRSAG